MRRDTLKPVLVALLALLPLPLTAAAPPAKTAAKPTPQVVKNLEERLGKWKPVEMTFEAPGFSAREKQLLDKLVEAARQFENIYWRQSDPEGLALYKSLADAKDQPSQDLRRMLWINGSRFDLLEENAPFVGKEPMQPGRTLYPKGITRQEIEAYAVAHPAEKAALYDEHTVIVRTPKGLATQPYHVVYKEYLDAAAKALREAAALSDEPAFANFLRLRADALLTDDYYASDLAWLDLQNPRFDIIFAPYETYLDGLLGVKTSYGAAVMVRNEAESRKLEVFQKYVPDIQDALPLAPEDRPSKRGRVAPMEVMDTPFRSGDLRHGYQAVADNLPNDPRIHEQKGSKRIFFKNYMEARVKYVILPVAQRLLREDQASLASAEGYLSDVMMHEISHGLGPAFARVDGKQIDIRQAIGATYSGLEEAKADVTGMFGLAWLVEHGALPKERLPEFYASYVAGIFRTVRFGTGEAHGRAQMMELNYLTEQGAIGREDSGRYRVDLAKMPAAIASLAKELLTIEATGDRARAESWFQKYGTMPADLKAALAKTADVPVDFDPIQPFPDGVE
jgi:hypothetical protein